MPNIATNVANNIRYMERGLYLTQNNFALVEQAYDEENDIMIMMWRKTDSSTIIILRDDNVIKTDPSPIDAYTLNIIKVLENM